MHSAPSYPAHRHDDAGRAPLTGNTTLKRNKPLIAIVDDDVEVCRSMERLLAAFGLKAYTFTSGEDFLDLLNTAPSFKPDCVILDVQMRGINGLAVQLQLGRIRPGTPVIFVSGTVDRKVSEEAQAAGAIVFFHKPFAAEALIAAVRSALAPGWIT
jgi:FixJ family two-component response regulator